MDANRSEPGTIIWLGFAAAGFDPALMGPALVAHDDRMELTAQAAQAA